MDQAYRHPKVREKLLVLGSHHDWANSEMSGKDQTSALWEEYPKELLRSLFFEIFQKEADDSRDLAGFLNVEPVWGKHDTRVGGYEKLGQIAEASTGYQNLNALLSGMSKGTFQSYLCGWRHWVQYCSLRGLEPWITVGSPGWGEAILDFIMFERSVLGLKPSPTAGKVSAIRYFHAIHGRPDFTASGVRCKLLMRSLTKRLPCCQKLPYNMDLMNWVHRHFFLNAPLAHRIKEIWAGLNLGFSYS